MKKIAILFITIAGLFLFSANDSTAQCKQQRVYDCSRKAGNAIYLRDFNTKLKPVRSARDINGTRWPLILNKGTRYRFNLCAKKYAKNIKLTLFDSKHPENKPWMSTEKSGRDMFDFVCQRSGVYYLSIRFKEGRSGRKKTCAIGVMSFVGKNQ